ncbi:TVP38/TMEM64 family protein [Desulfolithobacter sp.]
MPHPVNHSRKTASCRDISGHRLVRHLLVITLVFALFSSIGSIAKAHTAQFEAWIGSLGLTGMLAFLAAMTVLPLIGVTQTLFAFIGGALYGLMPGLIIVLTGATLNSTLAWFLGRILLAERVSRSLEKRPHLQAVVRKARISGPGVQILIRLLPLPAAPLCEALGATGVRFTPFFIGNLGAIPTCLLLNYFGYTAAHVTRAASGTSSLSFPHIALRILGLALLFICILLTIRFAQRKLLTGNNSKPS